MRRSCGLTRITWGMEEFPRPISGTTQLNVHIDQGGDLPIGMLCWDVFWIAGPGRGDDTNRSSFQPCFYGHTHTGTECVVHVPVTGVRYV